MSLNSTDYDNAPSKWRWWNWGLSILAVGYLVWQLIPLGSNFFILDDFNILNLGPKLKHNPFAWVNFTYFGWWRPIGLTLPGVFYLFFRLHPLPYHIAGLLIHVCATGSLYKLCRRFLDVHGSFYAALLFFVSPFFITAFTFISLVSEDELATAFLFIALASAMRFGTSQNTSPRLYWGSGIALMAAAACKDSWIGLLPAFILIDFMNYKQSVFWKRILRLLPLLLPFSITIGRLLVLGWDDISRITAWYIGMYFNVNNLVWGATLPFIPFTVIEFGLLQQVFRSGIVFFILVISLWLANNQRQIVGLLWLAYGGLLLSLGSTTLDNSLWGWLHLPPLVGLACIIYAITFKCILQRLHLTINWWLFCFVLPVMWIVLEQSTLAEIKKTVISDGVRNRRGAYSLLKIGKTLPTGSKIYAFFGLPSELVLAEMLPPGCYYTKILIKSDLWIRKVDRSLVIGSPELLKSLLIKEIKNPFVVFLVHNEDNDWRVVTNEIKSWLQGSEASVPPEIKEFIDREKGGEN